MRVASGEGAVVLRRKVELPSSEAGLARTTAAVPLPLPPGGYSVEVGTGAELLRWGLSILPAGAASATRAELERLSGRMAKATRSTLTFRQEDAERALASLQPTDPAPGPRMALENLRADLASLAGGKDPIRSATGLVRLAYRSRLDGTLQPYSLRIPEAGAKVEFVSEAGVGHEAPSAATHARYLAWLEEVAR